MAKTENFYIQCKHRSNRQVAVLAGLSCHLAISVVTIRQTSGSGLSLKKGLVGYSFLVAVTENSYARSLRLLIA